MHRVVSASSGTIETMVALMHPTIPPDMPGTDSIYRKRSTESRPSALSALTNSTVAKAPGEAEPRPLTTKTMSTRVTTVIVAATTATGHYHLVA